MTRTLTLGLLTIAALAAPAGAQTPPETKVEKPEVAKSDNPVAVIKTNHGDIHVELFAKDAPKTVANFLGLAEGTKPFTPAGAKKGASKVKRPFYDGLIFHRVIKKFMIQGGCPLGNGMGGPGYKFEDEINASDLGLDKIKAFDEKKGPHPWLMIRNRQQFQHRLLFPVFRRLGIKDAESFKKRKKEVLEILCKMTLKQAYESMGYRFVDKLHSHKPVRGSLAMANSGPNTNGSQFFINLVDTPWLTGKHTVFGKVIKGMDVVDEIGNVEVGDASKPKKPVKILSIRRLEAKSGAGPGR